MNDLFIELLQISLGNRDNLSRTPSMNEWTGLFKEAQRQAIIGVLLTGIEKLPKEQKPKKKLLLQWIALCQVVEQNNRLHLERARELTVLFNDDGFRSCVLKGIGISQLYPNPLRRQCGDIDLWVCGDRKSIMHNLCSHYTIGVVRWHHVDVHFFDDVQTEIHFNATWLFNPQHNKVLQTFLNSRMYDEMAEREIGFGYPTESFNAIYSLVHSFHHLLESGIGYRHIIDYYYIVKHLQKQDRDDVLAIIKGIGLNHFLQAMMFVLHEVCGMPQNELLYQPDDKEGRFLLKEIFDAGNFGHQRRDKKMRQNSFKRLYVMTKHYPSEMLWMIPWKLWHVGWRMTNKV